MARENMINGCRTCITSSFRLLIEHENSCSYEALAHRYKCRSSYNFIYSWPAMNKRIKALLYDAVSDSGCSAVVFASITATLCIVGA